MSVIPSPARRARPADGPAARQRLEKPRRGASGAGRAGAAASSTTAPRAGEFAGTAVPRDTTARPGPTAGPGSRHGPGAPPRHAPGTGPRGALGVLLTGLALTACADRGAPATGTPEVCALAAGELLITELMANPPGPDEGSEWFELFNPTDRRLVLTGAELEAGRQDGADPARHSLGPAWLEAGAYLVLGNAAAAYAPPHVDVGYGTALGTLRNARGRLALRCGGAEIDAVSYEAGRDGVALQRDGAGSSQGAAAAPAHWCAAMEAGGTPGQPNPPCPASPDADTCLDGTGRRAIRAPQPGDLLLSEIMTSPEQVADARGEWIELATRADLDLNGVELATGADRVDQVLGAPTCLAAPAGGRWLLARDPDPARNGGLPAVHGRLEVALASGTSARPGYLRIGHRGRLLDELHWTSSPAGASLAVDPGSLTSADRATRRLCPGRDPYGAGDLGSPGASNPACPEPLPEHGCRDTGGPRPVRRPRPGELFISEYMPDPAGIADRQGEWIELQASAAVDLNGLVLSPGEGTPVQTLSAEACLSLAPGDTALLARSGALADRPGLLVVPLDLALRNGSEPAPGVLVLRAGEQELDRVTWSGSRTGRSWSRDANGAWCRAETPYDDHNRGTPGAGNPPCP